MSLVVCGTSGRIRTCIRRVWRPLLGQLSFGRIGAARGPQWNERDSNPQPSACKTDALPIGATVPLLSFGQPKDREHPARIELASSGWKPGVLAVELRMLSRSKCVWKAGLEPASAGSQSRCAAACASSRFFLWAHPKNVGTAGLEPAAFRVSDGCSRPAELRPSRLFFCTPGGSRTPTTVGLSHAPLPVGLPEHRSPRRTQKVDCGSVYH